MKSAYCLSIFLSLASVVFAENPRWLSKPAISPDGSAIAFSYKGEIFTVPVTGGRALQITSNRAYDSDPVWSPDGKSIVFLSTREGSDDLYITSAEGGVPTRLTYHSGNEAPLAFLNDSTLLFNASIMPGKSSSRAPYFSQIYSINVNQAKARPTLFLSLPVLSLDVNDKGRIIYQNKKSYEDPLRKHERSSGTSDIWMYSDGNYTQLTHFNGQDQSPVWGLGNNFYYLSEKDGTLNVFQADISGSNEKQLTDFQKHPVRSLSASQDGNLLAFAWDGDIYTLKPGDQPRKVNIEINADLYDGDLVKNYVNTGASNFAVSEDGNQIALIIRGDLYVTDAKYKTTKRITDTPAQERSVSFAPDGRSLVFDSDVDGIWQLFTAKIKNDDEKEFPYATDIEIEPLYKCETSAMQPQFSPDGKKVAFLENRGPIRVIDVKSKQVNTALDGKYNYSYSDGDITFKWSPDSQWLLTSYMGPMGWNNMDIAVVKADGSEIVDLTESGYNDYQPQWALDGKAVVYATGKYGMKSSGSWGNQDDLMIMVLDGDAWDQFNFTAEEAELFEKAKKEKDDEESEDKDSKKKKKKADKEDKKKVSELDLANRRYRTKRLTSTSSLIMDYYLDPKGEKLYYIALGPDGDFNLWVSDLKKGDVNILAPGLTGSLFPDKEGENLFVLSYDGIKKISLPDGDMKPVEFEAPYDRHPSLERKYIFDHMAKQVEDKFYDKNLHGVDWKYYTDHYREFLPYVSNNRDFATLLSEVLGELNASHTGGRAYSAGAPLSTSSLGAYFDESYNGAGLKIVEILPRGPLANKSADVKPGDIITSIDGVEILPGQEYYSLLEGKAGKKVRLGVTKVDGSSKFINVRPISLRSQSEMAYQRWIERNEAIADSVSGGKVGYVHVRGMDTESFQNVYERLLGKYRNYDAVVVDTRFNGGGWLHNDLAILLSGHKYVTFSPRGEEIGIEPFSQWTKPSVMLVNEANYSDAHGSPYTYQTLGLGEVVGAPIPGTMTAVWWENQIDPLIVFGIPQVTNRANDGTILENTQLNPDIEVYNLPADVEAGIDSQLEAAIKSLLTKIQQEEQTQQQKQ